MEVAFDSKELRTICEADTTATRELGVNVADTLRRRLADLRAASTINDLPVGSPHALEGAAGRARAVELTEGYRIVIAANHRSNPRTENGELDWSRVGRIKVLRIELGP